MSSQSELFSWENRIQEAREKGDPAAEARAQVQAGKIALARHQFQQAHHRYRRAFDLFSGCGLNQEAVRAANHLAVCLILKNRPEEALAVLEPLSEGLDAAENPDLTAAVTGNLGLAHTKMENYTQGAACHKQALELGEKIGSSTLRLQAQINLADCYLQEGRYRQAQGFALVARDLARQLGSKRELVVVYDLLGMISARQGDHQEAVRCHRRAYELAADLGDLHQQALSLGNQALSQEALTNLEDARELLSRARDLFQSLNSNYLEKTERDLLRIRRSLGPGANDPS